MKNRKVWLLAPVVIVTLFAGSSDSSSSGRPVEDVVTPLRVSPLEQSLGLGAGEESAVEKLIFDLQRACADGTADQFTWVPSLVVREQSGFGHTDAHLAFAHELRAGGRRARKVDASRFCEVAAPSGAHSALQALMIEIFDRELVPEEAALFAREELEWSRCMEAAGYEFQELQDMYDRFQSDAIETLQSLMDRSQDDDALPVVLLEAREYETAVARAHLACGGTTQAAGPLVTELAREDAYVRAFVALDALSFLAAEREVEVALSVLGGPLSETFLPGWDSAETTPTRDKLASDYLRG